MKDNLVLVFPTFFESPSLMVLFENIQRLLCPSFNVVIYLLDDSCGSDFELKGLDQKFPVQIKLISHTHRKGHQQALCDFIKWHLPQIDPSAIVVTLDADGEDLIEDIAPMISLLANNKNRIVLAQRLSRKRGVIYNICFVLYMVLFRLLTSTNVRTGNFACFRPEYFEGKLGSVSFDKSYAASFYHWPDSIVYYPCHKGVRIKGETKMTVFALIKHAISLLGPFKKQVILRLGVVFAILLLALFLNR
jgi:hypothetical protein